MLVATLAAISVGGVSPARSAPIQPKLAELPAEGVNLRRPKGGWLNVTLKNAQMLLSFFDNDKLAISPNIEKALVRVRYTNTAHVERTVLTREGDVLKSPGSLRPPYYFAVTLTLFPKEAEHEAAVDAHETYTFMYP